MTTSHENPYPHGSDIYSSNDNPLTELDLTFEGGPQENYSAANGVVEAVFRDHQQRLIALIREAKREDWFCFGAVAWLTDPKLLYELSDVPSSILVQKEDFLRPDLGQRDGGSWQERLQKSYEAVPSLPYDRYLLLGIASDLSYLGDPDVGRAIRCIGERPSDGSRTHPRMHNKFLVFASHVDRSNFNGSGIDDVNSELAPGWNAQVVWTGSYNLSRNAERSWENALIVRDSVIAEAYLKEWSQLFTFSEPLNWQSRYIAPEWRIGT